MVGRALALVLALATTVVPAAASASPGRFAAHASFQPTGCTQTVAGSVVTLAGCSASVPFGGSGRGTFAIAYGATVDLTKGGGTQQGTITLHGASARDRLALAFAGTVTLAGRSHGTWKAIARTGAFAKTAPRSGTYASSSPDQGAHVSFDVRG